MRSASEVWSEFLIRWSVAVSISFGWHTGKLDSVVAVICLAAIAGIDVAKLIRGSTGKTHHPPPAASLIILAFAIAASNGPEHDQHRPVVASNRTW